MCPHPHIIGRDTPCLVIVMPCSHMSSSLYTSSAIIPQSLLDHLETPGAHGMFVMHMHHFGHAHHMHGMRLLIVHSMLNHHSDDLVTHHTCTPSDMIGCPVESRDRCDQHPLPPCGCAGSSHPGTTPRDGGAHHGRLRCARQIWRSRIMMRCPEKSTCTTEVFRAAKTDPWARQTCWSRFHVLIEKLKKLDRIP